MYQIFILSLDSTLSAWEIKKCVIPKAKVFLLSWNYSKSCLNALLTTVEEQFFVDYISNPVDPYNPDMTFTTWKKKAWGAGDVTKPSWENMVVGQGNTNCCYEHFGWGPGDRLLEGDKTHLAFRKGLLHYFLP